MKRSPYSCKVVRVLFSFYGRLRKKVTQRCHSLNTIMSANFRK